MDKQKQAMLVGAVVAGLVLAYFARKGVAQVATAINPLNNDNIVNRGFTSVYQSVTGSTGTLGTDLYDVTHDGTFNPASTNNAIYRNIGGKDWSVGTVIYDWFN